MDAKKLGRIGRIGHRIHGDRTARVRGIGWETLYVAINDATRLTYAEVRAEAQETGDGAAAFLARALAWFAARGIRVERVMTDNGGGFRSRCVRALLGRHTIRHLRTRPYTPRTNGKAERVIQMLLASGPTRTPTRAPGCARGPCGRTCATTTSSGGAARSATPPQRLSYVCSVNNVLSNDS